MRKLEKEEYIVYDDQKNRLREYPAQELPISKKAIAEKSIYYFDDPNPCFIHTNAVLVRLLEEIKKYLRDRNEPIFIHELPTEIVGYLDLGKEVSYIEYCSYK